METEWIRVSDRLPSYSGRFLVAIFDPDDGQGVSVADYRFDSGWIAHNSTKTSLFVTHWQRVPSPEFFLSNDRKGAFRDFFKKLIAKENFAEDFTDESGSLILSAVVDQFYLDTELSWALDDSGRLWGKRTGVDSFMIHDYDENGNLRKLAEKRNVPKMFTDYGGNVDFEKVRSAYALFSY